jgi:hypothetical protein
LSGSRWRASWRQRDPEEDHQEELVAPGERVEHLLEHQQRDDQRGGPDEPVEARAQPARRSFLLLRAAGVDQLRPLGQFTLPWLLDH